MAFESNNFNVVKKSQLERSEFTVECNIALTCSKILVASAAANVLNYEVLNGSINYSGNIDVKIVYMSEDGEIGSLTSACPFTSKFEGENIANGQKAIINLKVIDAAIDSVTSDNIKLSVNIEQSGVVISSDEIHSIKSNDPDICSKDEAIKVVKFLGENSETVTVKGELALRGGVKKLILSESQTYVKNVESGVNFVTVNGEVVTRVLYLSEDDKFETNYLYDAFKEEIELEGTSRESEVEGYAAIKCGETKAEIEEGDKAAKLNIETPILVSVKAYENAEVSVIKDVYSTKNDLQISTESFEMTNVCKMENVEGKIDGNLTLDDEKPRVDKIMFIGGNKVVVSNSYISEGEINIEGIATTTVVYLNDETSSLQSAQIDVPFVISDKTSFESENGTLSVDAIVCDVDVVVKKGREFYYDAKVRASVNYCEPVISGVISEASVLDQYQERDYGMELIFAQAGQDAWDIAKEAKVKEEMLIYQNSEVVFPLQEDQSLILFHQQLQ